MSKAFARDVRFVRTAVMLALIAALAVMGLLVAHRSAPGHQLAGGTCYEIYNATLTPGGPATVCD